MKYMTVADIAAGARVDEVVVRYYLRKGWIGARRMGGRIMFDAFQANLARDFIRARIQEGAVLVKKRTGENGG